MTQPSLKDLSARVDQHVKNARFIGKLSVDMAQKKIQQFCATSHSSSAEVVVVPTVATEHSTVLPIDNYDALTAKDIVAALSGLTPTQLLAVFDYENTHRQRRTILKAASSGNE
jgi:cystathionine beta-lyase/cystathionine gamma-synthase